MKAVRSAGVRARRAPAGLALFLALALPGAPARAEEERYVAGEGLLISVPLDTSSFLNGGFPIDSAGYVDLPVLGKLDVAGKTRPQVEAYLADKMSAYLKDVHLSCKPAIRLTMAGFWAKPGVHYVDASATVWDALAVAGGPAGEKTLLKMKVMRGSQVAPISLLDVYSSGATLRGAGVRSGDLFTMPVPDDHNFWYWFTQGLSATAQVATVIATGLTAYLTYETFHQHNP